MLDVRPILEHWSGVPLTAAKLTRELLARDDVRVILWVNRLSGSDAEIRETLRERILGATKISHGFTRGVRIESIRGDFEFVRTQIPSVVLSGLFTLGVPLELILRAMNVKLSGEPNAAVSFDAAHPLVTRMRRIVLVHDLASLHFPEFFSLPHRIRTRLTLGRTLRSADMLLTNSTFTAWDVRRAVDRDATAIGLGADHVTHEARSTKHEARGTSLLTISTLEPRKNLRTLLAVWPRFRARHPDAELLVAGGESPRTFARAHLRIPTGVRLLGPVSETEKTRLLEEARTFVMPSLFEGWGLPAAEARALGVPVAASRVPGLVEAAPDAHFFAPTDADEMLRALEAAWDSPRSPAANQETWRDAADRLIRAIRG